MANEDNILSEKFDREWYLQEYPDVKKSNIDPLEHYKKCGAKEGRYCSADDKLKHFFDPEWYLQEYPDVKESGIEPLEYYKKIGQQEGHYLSQEDKIKHLFDPEWYLQEYPDVKKSNIDPLEHYKKRGEKEGRYCSADDKLKHLFDPEWYLQEYPDVSKSGIEPLEYYKKIGQQEGHYLSQEDKINHLFDPEWYLREYQDVKESGKDPLEHYKKYGIKHGRYLSQKDKLNHLLDPEWYLQKYPAVKVSGLNPIEHYIQYGQALNLYISNFDQLAHKLDAGWYVTKYTKVKATGLSPLEHYKKYGIKEGKYISKDDENYSLFSKTFLNTEIFSGSYFRSLIKIDSRKNSDNNDRFGFIVIGNADMNTYEVFSAISNYLTQNIEIVFIFEKNLATNKTILHELQKFTTYYNVIIVYTDGDMSLYSKMLYAYTLLNAQYICILTLKSSIHKKLFLENIKEIFQNNQEYQMILPGDSSKKLIDQITNLCQTVDMFSGLVCRSKFFGHILSDESVNKDLFLGTYFQKNLQNNTIGLYDDILCLTKKVKTISMKKIAILGNQILHLIRNHENELEIYFNLLYKNIQYVVKNLNPDNFKITLLATLSLYIFMLYYQKNASIVQYMKKFDLILNFDEQLSQAEIKQYYHNLLDYLFDYKQSIDMIVLINNNYKSNLYSSKLNKLLTKNYNILQIPLENFDLHRNYDQMLIKMFLYQSKLIVSPYVLTSDILPSNSRQLILADTLQNEYEDINSKQYDMSLRIILCSSDELLTSYQENFSATTFLSLQNLQKDAGDLSKEEICCDLIKKILS